MGAMTSCSASMFRLHRFDQSHLYSYHLLRFPPVAISVVPRHSYLPFVTCKKTLLHTVFFFFFSPAPYLCLSPWRSQQSQCSSFHNRSLSVHWFSPDSVMFLLSSAIQLSTFWKICFIFFCFTILNTTYNEPWLTQAYLISVPWNVKMYQITACFVFFMFLLCIVIKPFSVHSRLALCTVRTLLPTPQARCVYAENTTVYISGTQLFSSIKTMSFWVPPSQLEMWAV